MCTVRSDIGQSLRGVGRGPNQRHRSTPPPQAKPLPLFWSPVHASRGRAGDFASKEEIHLYGSIASSSLPGVCSQQQSAEAPYNGSSYSWDFATNQYDCIGSAAGNTSIYSQTNGAVIDLFGWV